MTESVSTAADSPPVDSRHVAGAVGASIGGLLVHNLFDFPLSILLAPETLVPVAITVLLGVAMYRRPGWGVYSATIGWAILVIVVGGASVLPLSIWPFVPDQSIGHYVVHVVYAVAQLPLLLVGWRGVRSYRRS